MKKFLLLIQLLIFLNFMQANAMCPLEIQGDTVCSMQNFKDSPLPLFQNNNSSINSTSQSPQTNLQPYINEQSSEQTKLNKQNNNSNLNCQFGLCPQNFNNQVQQK